MITNRNDLRITVLTGALILLALIVLPENRMFTNRVICPSRLLFHLECPFCGLTRAVWCILHGRWTAAWHLNFNAYLLLAWYLALAGRVFVEPMWIKKLDRVLLVLLGVGLVIRFLISL